jgi:hypothetical protein
VSHIAYSKIGITPSVGEYRFLSDTFWFRLPKVSSQMTLTGTGEVLRTVD